MNYIYLCINEYSKGYGRVYARALLCLLLLVCPLYANVNLYVKENINYFVNMINDRSFRNKLEGRGHSYRWLLDMKKNNRYILIDSQVSSLSAIIMHEFREFPSNIGSVYMNDSLCVAFFVAVFCDTTISDEVTSISRRNGALTILLNETSSGVLMPHREKILFYMKNWKWASFDEKAIVAARLKCTEKERASLFNGRVAIDSLPLTARVWYGDKKAIVVCVDV
ncbi:MAG: hypothetical protein LBH93_04180 [Chitinispirillales bacterium]|jgi:hypothetical protein|nr:hypothetical protein [Chitinispirillales bacterium]